VFSKFKLVRWGWVSGTVSLLVGGYSLETSLALFNHLTPSGRVTVTGRVVEVTPNVTGQIVAIPVKPNVPMKVDDVLFQIDPVPFQYKVAQLQAQLDSADWELALSGNAGVIDLLASILVWVGSYTAHLQPARRKPNTRKKRTSLDCAARFR
jgi:multidrug resistance efflux pump